MDLEEVRKRRLQFLGLAPLDVAAESQTSDITSESSNRATSSEHDRAVTADTEDPPVNLSTERTSQNSQTQPYTRNDVVYSSHNAGHFSPQEQDGLNYHEPSHFTLNVPSLENDHFCVERETGVAHSHTNNNSSNYFYSYTETGNEHTAPTFQLSGSSNAATPIRPYSDSSVPDSSDTVPRAGDFTSLVSQRRDLYRRQSESLTGDCCVGQQQPSHCSQYAAESQVHQVQQSTGAHNDERSLPRASGYSASTIPSRNIQRVNKQPLPELQRFAVDSPVHQVQQSTGAHNDERSPPQASGYGASPIPSVNVQRVNQQPSPQLQRFSVDSPVHQVQQSTGAHNDERSPPQASGYRASAIPSVNVQRLHPQPSPQLQRFSAEALVLREEQSSNLEIPGTYQATRFHASALTSPSYTETGSFFHPTMSPDDTKTAAQNHTIGSSLSQSNHHSLQDNERGFPPRRKTIVGVVTESLGSNVGVVPGRLLHESFGSGDVQRHHHSGTGETAAVLGRRGRQNISEDRRRTVIPPWSSEQTRSVTTNDDHNSDQENMSDASGVEELEDRQMTCPMCQKYRGTLLIVSCGHGMYCSTCISSRLRRTPAYCPSRNCRKRIDGKGTFVKAHVVL